MLFQCDDIRVWFPVFGGKLVQRRVGYIKAVDGVSFGIERGTTFALVGESGCGKTTLAKTILGLQKPTSGSMSYDGESLLYADDERKRHGLKRREGKLLRKKVQCVLQDPALSLNPRMSVRDLVGEGIDIHERLSPAERNDKVTTLLDLVEIDSKGINRFPQEFSAGQRQRIAIARHLAVDPEFLVLDEPVSSLDVSVQSRIIELLNNLQKRLGLTYLFISHDLAVVKKIADRVAVMYLGKIVEEGPAETLYANPRHPYTKALLASLPIPDPRRARSRISPELSEEIPSAEHIPSGCRFHPRCPIREMPLCKTEEPQLEKKRKSHFVSCHLVK